MPFVVEEEGGEVVVKQISTGWKLGCYINSGVLSRSKHHICGSSNVIGIRIICFALEPDCLIPSRFLSMTTV